jgi:hypothetical protein
MTKEELEAEYSRIVEAALNVSEYDICESFQRACEKVAPDWTFEDCQLVGTTLYISALPPDLVHITMSPRLVGMTGNGEYSPAPSKPPRGSS